MISLFYKLLNSKFSTSLRRYLFYYLLLLVGLTLISGGIYIRFLRTRLPRDIPFTLNLYSFLCLLFICGMYCYIIKTLIKEKKIGILYKRILPIITKPLELLRNALQTLDFTVKNNIMTKQYYKKMMENYIPIIINYGSIEYAALYYFFTLLPGYLLLFIFLVDVFWLHRIAIFYYFLFLNVLPLTYSYYNYSLVAIREQYFTTLESRYISVMIYDENYDYEIKFGEKNPRAFYNDKELSVREYFTMQLKQLHAEYSEYDPEDANTYEIIYVGYPICKPELYREYEKNNNKTIADASYEELEFLKKEFRTIEPTLLGLIEYIDLNHYTKKTYYIKELRILLYTMYLLTWFYILIKSLHTLPQDYFTWLIPRYDNPF